MENLVKLPGFRTGTFQVQRRHVTFSAAKFSFFSYIKLIFSTMEFLPLFRAITYSYRGNAITLIDITHCRPPPDEWSARRRDLYLKTHSTHNRQTSMPPAEFETTILTSERPLTHTSDRVATGIKRWKSCAIFSCMIAVTLINEIAAFRTHKIY